MSFAEIYLSAALLLLIVVITLWLLSVLLRDSSIVDIFWGMGFVLLAWFYFWRCQGNPTRQWLVVILVSCWGIRLSLYIFWRNRGKGEDFRYRVWRKQHGANYWWVSFFRVYLLQGTLLWLISAPLLGAQFYPQNHFSWCDGLAIALWVIGFLFEAVGDWQLMRFIATPGNKGKLLTSGVWQYTRHPNYFGDACLWWGYALFSCAAGSFISILSAFAMTFLLIRVSGVALLEKTLKKKPGYEQYIHSTSAFFPWFPKKDRS